MPSGKSVSRSARTVPSGPRTSGGGCPAEAYTSSKHTGSMTPTNAVTNGACPIARTMRSTAFSTATGSGLISAAVRMLCRTLAIATAASSPFPATSPTETTTRPSGNRNASYQSPPTVASSIAAWYIAWNVMPRTASSCARIAASRWYAAASRTSPCSSTKFTTAQSANSGTMRRVMTRSVWSSESAPASSVPNCEKKRSRARAPCSASMSVLVPYQRTTAPLGSRSGIARVRNQRNAPSARRSRNSISNGSPVAIETRHALIASARSSGWCTARQPQPAASSGVWPVYSYQRALYQSIQPSGSADHIICGTASAITRNDCVSRSKLPGPPGVIVRARRRSPPCGPDAVDRAAGVVGDEKRAVRADRDPGRAARARAVGALAAAAELRPLRVGIRPLDWLRRLAVLERDERDARRHRRRVPGAVQRHEDAAAVARRKRVRAFLVGRVERRADRRVVGGEDDLRQRHAGAARAADRLTVVVALRPAVVRCSRVRGDRVEDLVRVAVLEIVAASDAGPDVAALRLHGKRDRVADVDRARVDVLAVRRHRLHRRARRIRFAAGVARRADAGVQHAFRERDRRRAVPGSAARPHARDLLRGGARLAVARAVRNAVDAELAARVQPLAGDEHARQRAVLDRDEAARLACVLLRVGDDVDRVAVRADEQVAVRRDRELPRAGDARDALDREAARHGERAAGGARGPAARGRDEQRPGACQGQESHRSHLSPGVPRRAAPYQAPPGGLHRSAISGECSRRRFRPGGCGRSRRLGRRRRTGCLGVRPRRRSAGRSARRSRFGSR